MKKLGIALAAALLAGCSILRQAQDDTQLSQGDTPLAGVPAQHSLVGETSGSSGYLLLHAFGDPGRPHRNAGGVNPDAPLIEVNGALYGTTRSGGRPCHTRDYDLNGCGTVFRVSTSGVWKPLYRFRGGSDGAHPDAGLIDVNGTLYGTTSSGGGGYGCPGTGCGTVFSITTAGVEKVLYDFQGGKDGQFPFSSLTYVNGSFYGVTFKGGITGCGNSAEGCGTVYSLSASGVEKVLHRFKGGADEGTYPWAGLTDVSGALYGTTEYGGRSGCAVGCGTVFKITTGGNLKTLYDFQGHDDGGTPTSTLVKLNGLLYGTTVGWVGTSGTSLADGTVYSVTTGGSEKVLIDFTYHSFQQGWAPYGGLVAVNGVLYGTTLDGGSCQSTRGCGTIFSITTSGAMSELYSFTGTPDSNDPQSALLAVNGVLYGTTLAGGNLGCKPGLSDRIGCGTVYAFTP